MSGRDPARASIALAQSLELAGDRRGAAEALAQAARLHTERGQHARAMSLLQNVKRLAPDRPGIDAAIAGARREHDSSISETERQVGIGSAAEFTVAPVGAAALEQAIREANRALGGPEQAAPSVVASFPREVVRPRPNPELRGAVARPQSEPLDLPDAPGGLPSGPSVEAEPAAPSTLDADRFERGPVLAAEGLSAWCSFCCRPREEVGPLVAGPAGAFICSGCIALAGGLLGQPTPAPTSSPAKAAVPVPRPAAGGDIWIGPEPLLELALAALKGRAAPVVVVGPTGSGKSALLEQLARTVPGASLHLAGAELPPPTSGPLLVEHLELISGAERRALQGRPFVASSRSPAMPVGLPGVLVVPLPPADRNHLEVLLDRWLRTDRVDPLPPAARDRVLEAALRPGRGPGWLFQILVAERSVPGSMRVLLELAGAGKDAV